MESEPESHHGDQSKRNGSCGFTTLGFGALEAVDPLLLAVAFLFILTLGFIAYPPRRHATPRRNLPPAQGPPLFG
jgi:hypothetical protein